MVEEFNEASLRRDTIDTLERFGCHVTNHEDKWKAGISDISWAANGRDGWLELKNINLKGVKPFNLGFTSAQVTWLRKRHEAGCGKCYGLVRVCQDGVDTFTYLLFTPSALVPIWSEKFTLSSYFGIAAASGMSLHNLLRVVVV